MRVVFTGGGTGGHVYPGLSVLEALRCQAATPLEVHYIGRRGGAEERIVAAAGVPFHAVPAAGLRGKSAPAAARALAALAAGTTQAWRLLGRLQPRAVFATGGYASVPVAVAARLRRIPLLLFLPDVYPGWAVRFLARIATRIATSTDQALAALPRERTVVTGYPVRAAFFAVDRPSARARLGLPPAQPVVLVAGGSSGARDLNRAVARHLPQFLRMAHLVHVSGPPFEAELRRLAERLPTPLQPRYRLFGYLEDMPAAMAAADVAVLRAGASTLGELPAVGLPAVLVPGPFSDQAKNARYLAERGAAVVVDNAMVDHILPAVHDLLRAPERLAAMRRAMTALARPAAAAELARLLLEVAA